MQITDNRTGAYDVIESQLDRLLWNMAEEVKGLSLNAPFLTTCEVNSLTPAALMRWKMPFTTTSGRK